DFAHERLIGTPADLSHNPGKFQLPLAQNRGAPHNPGKFQLPLAQNRGAPQMAKGFAYTTRAHQLHHHHQPQL
ncbi:hypothetical protein, partial [Rhizobium rhizogenes]|uniref:hypothetical protein n=1 Tax=Rhizobium rhizogenes TaxID=359 RepID=UPI001AEE61AF